MFTAHTITDEQIRELKAEMDSRVERGVDTREDRLALAECIAALGEFLDKAERDEGIQLRARARCAEILNEDPAVVNGSWVEEF